MNNTAECYHLFSESFYEPREGWFEKDGHIGRLMVALTAVLPDLETDIFKGLIKHDGIQNLVVEYARLFVGPFALQAPPYGSYYLEPEKQVMGTSTLAVRAMYAENGLAITGEVKELPDHIAVELEFLHFLDCKAQEAEEAGDKPELEKIRETKHHFYNSFFSSFALAFCRRIKEGTESGFYTALADSLTAFVEAEKGLLTGKGTGGA